MPLTIEETVYLTISEAMNYIDLARGIEVSPLTFRRMLTQYDISTHTFPEHGKTQFIAMKDLGLIPVA